MRRYLIAFILTMFALAASAAPPPQADKSQRPSPPGTAEVTLKGKKITIEYSRPFLKGRHVGQELAPYDKVWRTGANEATSLTTEIDLNIGGASVPAGKYTLYTLPSEGTWKLIINKQTGQWGTAYDEKQDLARVEMKVSNHASPTEQFTIGFDQTSTTSAVLKLDWADTIAKVDVKEQK